MVQFLTPEWFAAQAGRDNASGPVQLTIQQRVTGGPEGDVAYIVQLVGDALVVEPGEADNADVTITQSYETARAIHEGRLGALAAVAAGDVRVEGAVNLLREHGAALEAARG